MTKEQQEALILLKTAILNELESVAQLGKKKLYDGDQAEQAAMRLVTVAQDLAHLLQKGGLVRIIGHLEKTTMPGGPGKELQLVVTMTNSRENRMALAGLDGSTVALEACQMELNLGSDKEPATEEPDLFGEGDSEEEAGEE
jgi:hypothetical protein